GGSGVVWTVPNVAGWNSTYSGNVPLITVDQLPSRAVATAGVYDWAISVQPLADGTNEIRWYFIKKAAAGKPTDYWFGGTVIEKNPVSTKFNGIMFSVNNDVDETCKQVNINDVKVDMGNPLTIPEAPWQAFYVDAWGVLGQRRGNAGWVMTPGDVIGDVTMSGKVAPTDFAVVRGQFGTLVMPTTAKALIVTGNIEFVGGGFDNWGFRYGLFNSDAGKVETAAYYNWLGAETKHSGYLFFPQSGGKYPWDWPGGKAGTFGGIFNEVPVYNYSAQDYPVGTAIPIPTNVIAKAGRYDFAISVQPLADGTAEIRHFLTSRDKKYFWADKAIDKNITRAATKFNSIVFALGQNASTTAMKIHDVKVDIGNAITLPTPTAVEDVVSSIPTEYSLNQNYPNPFNPTTTIEYALPKSGAVKLVVYDVLGREVAELVNKDLDAGYHKVDFNAASISSGVYFYSIKTGDFASVKKLILLK
ncbi:MAG: T9SS type A sorting domain-containing protein, partial [Ignavibacteria bacterium]|nr:T9SS type A sorting domain-containing protein [Ignavibacteria bacterium]